MRPILEAFLAERNTGAVLPLNEREVVLLELYDAWRAARRQARRTELLDAFTRGYTRGERNAFIIASRLAPHELEQLAAVAFKGLTAR